MPPALQHALWLVITIALSGALAFAWVAAGLPGPGFTIWWISAGLMWFAYWRVRERSSS